ncbi:MAG: hypothetical protein ACM3NH_01515 [Candidatus Saccharibacteria bacterium]
MCGILVFSLLVGGLTIPSQKKAEANAAPSLPAAQVDISRPARDNSRIISVKNSCSGIARCYTSLQSAVDQATPGDTILIDQKIQVTGPVNLKNKGTGAGWIVIGTNLPASDLRVTPSEAINFAKISAPGNNAPAINVLPGAHHYRLENLEVMKSSPAAVTGELISVGRNDSSQTSLGSQPHHIIFNRVYAHGDASSNLKRGIALNGADLAVINSYISDCHSTEQDSQALASFNGSGPFRIENNYLEASGENLMFGGDDPKISNLVPSDIEIRKNVISKPLRWKENDPAYAGVNFVNKNLLEFKNARRALIEGNRLEHSWKDAQAGFAVLFNTTNQGGGCSWCEVADMTFRNNIVQGTGNGIELQGNDYHFPSSSGRTRRVAIENNLFQDIGGGYGNGWLLSLEGGTSEPGPEDVTFRHNTALNTGLVLSAGSYFQADGSYSPKPGFVFDDNLVAHNAYGIKGMNTGIGDDTLTKYFPSSEVRANVIVGGPENRYSLHPGNYFPSDWPSVGFTDQAKGDFSLKSTSAYKARATDGKDIGADFGAIYSAMEVPSTAAPIMADTIRPVVRSFDAVKAGPYSVQATFTVADTGGSHVLRAELWRARYDSVSCNDSAKSGCLWTRAKDVLPGSSGIDLFSGAFYDTPGTGSFWYSVHGVDRAGNWGHEESALKISL